MWEVFDYRTGKVHMRTFVESDAREVCESSEFPLDYDYVEDIDSENE